MSPHPPKIPVFSGDVAGFARLAMRIAHAVMGHLSRMGGILVRPQSTLLGLMQGSEGNALEVVPWIVIVVAIISPGSVGHALLLMRARLFDGFLELIQVVAARMSAPLFSVLAAAAVLHIVERFKRPAGARVPRIGFDRAIDVCAFMLVPFLVITVVGFLMAVAGLNLWWMPHNKMFGDLPTMIIRVLVAYGWSLVLFGIAVRVLWTAEEAA